QDRRAVRVDNALRAAGRAARVAHRRGFALVELRIAPVLGGRAGQELLVRVLDDEDMLDLRLAGELLVQRHKAAVDDERAVAGMSRDVADVLRVQPQVERVEDESAAGNAEVRLQVLVVVPAESRNAVAAFEPDAVECYSELLRASREVAVRVAVEAFVRQAGDDLLLAEERLSAP